MNGREIALLVVVCAAFVAAVVYLIVRKIRGKSGCDCGGSCGSSPGCACCPHCVAPKTPDETLRENE